MPRGSGTCSTTSRCPARTSMRISVPSSGRMERSSSTRSAPSQRAAQRRGMGTSVAIALVDW
eukprot:9539490-Alexandrium_andersonii.AAC.1